MSAKTMAVIPQNSSLLETGLDLAFAKLLDRIEPPFPQLMDPAKSPADFLSYLAADRGVDEWRATAPESEKRATVAASWQTKRLAGTRAALARAVAGLEMTSEITAWYERTPLGAPYTFYVLAWIDRAYDLDIDTRLVQRLQAAKSERDGFALAVGITATGATNIAAAVTCLEVTTIYPGVP